MGTEGPASDAAKSGQARHFPQHQALVFQAGELNDADGHDTLLDDARKRQVASRQGHRGDRAAWQATSGLFSITVVIYDPNLPQSSARLRGYTKVFSGMTPSSTTEQLQHDQCLSRRCTGKPAFNLRYLTCHHHKTTAAPVVPLTLHSGPPP